VVDRTRRSERHKASLQQDVQVVEVI
jgi:hypothetical protein